MESSYANDKGQTFEWFPMRLSHPSYLRTTSAGAGGDSSPIKNHSHHTSVGGDSQRTDRLSCAATDTGAAHFVSAEIAVSAVTDAGTKHAAMTTTIRTSVGFSTLI